MLDKTFVTDSVHPANSINFATIHTHQELEQLRSFFTGRELPKTVELSKSTTITDTKAFLKSHFSVLELNGDKPTFSAFWQRLYQLKAILENTPA